MTDGAGDRTTKIELSTARLVGLLCLMAMGSGLLGYGLTTLGRSLIGGDAGEWIGLAAAFAIVCVVCWVIYGTMSHPHLGAACIAWVCMSASKVGDEIGKDLGGNFAPKWGSSIALVVVFLILVVISNRMDKRNPPNSPSSDE